MYISGFRSYGSMLIYNNTTHPYPITSTNAYTAPGKLFRDVDKISKVNQRDKDVKTFGSSKRRRAQFRAIAIATEAYITAVPNIGNGSVSGGSNRWGALMMKFQFEVCEATLLMFWQFSTLSRVSCGTPCPARSTSQRPQPSSPLASTSYSSRITGDARLRR
ncbi:hypothetical protein EDB80DRAFT_724065 [Ilyonectria destructans]|nr:hypothetical protein EDB80DRAFT_724065 [Ilyonectria destructans]